MYERLALWMRYFFALLAVLFVVRAWVITVRDNRRARVLRAWLPETGTIGEWLVLGAPGGQERKNARYPILNEGTIGSSRRCDVRLVYPDVLREHAYFAATETGLRVRPVGEAPLCVESQVGGVYHPADGYVDMADGDVLVLGGLRMMLTLFDAPRPSGRGRALCRRGGLWRRIRSFSGRRKRRRMGRRFGGRFGRAFSPKGA